MIYLKRPKKRFLIKLQQNIFVLKHYKHGHCLFYQRYVSIGIQKWPAQLYPQYLAQVVGFWVSCGVKRMSSHHGWGWQPPQTAPYIHIRHIQSVWPHLNTVQDRHTISALYIYTQPTWLRLRFWGSIGNLGGNGVIMSWLRLTATSKDFPHPNETYKKCLSTLICCPWAYHSSLAK